jgi:hypothetical protein
MFGGEGTAALADGKLERPAKRKRTTRQNRFIAKPLRVFMFEFKTTAAPFASPSSSSIVDSPCACASTVRDLPTCIIARRARCSHHHGHSSNCPYGTTTAGGNAANGTLFALNTDGTGFGDGANPHGALILSGHTLYGSALTLSNAWSTVGQPAITNSGKITITVPASSPAKFFRLKSL